MLLNSADSSEIMEVITQHPWLRQYLYFLAGISSSEAPVEKSRKLKEFMGQQGSRISLHSWEKLQLNERGIKTSRNSDLGELNFLMRYTVIYRDHSDHTIKHQDSVSEDGKEEPNLLPTPSAIIDDLVRNKVARGHQIQFLGVVKMDSIFKTHEVRKPLALALYCFPDRFQPAT